MNINILKKAQCGNLSNPDKPTLTYDIGHHGDEFHFRVTDNAGGGFFSQEWICLSHIEELLPTDTPFTTIVLAELFGTKNSNNQGFLAAVLKNVKLLLPIEGNNRAFTVGDIGGFTKSMQTLIKKKVSLNDDVAALKAEKEIQLKALEKKLKAQRAKSSKPKSRAES